MNFVVKISNQIGSRIAVQYASEYQARSAYEKLVENQKSESFVAQVELFDGKLNLIITSKTNGLSSKYVQLTYSVLQIQQLMRAIETDHKFHFYHIYSKNNILTVSKPFGKNKFITLNAIHVLNPVNL